MQRRPEQPVFARLGRADVVLRLCLLPLHVRLGRAPRFRAVLEQPALPGDPLRRHGRCFFDVLYLPAAPLHSRALQLLPHLRRGFRSASLRGALALSNHPPCPPANRSFRAAWLIAARTPRSWALYSGFSGCGHSHRAIMTAAIAPSTCAAMNASTPAGAMPAKVSDSERAIVTAGLANEVEAVNQ